LRTAVKMYLNRPRPEPEPECVYMALLPRRLSSSAVAHPLMKTVLFLAPQGNNCVQLLLP
jgi:hypothetical protein